MSLEAMVWVFQFSKSRGLDRLVLLALANRHNQEKGGCWPSHSTIAADCGIHVSTAKRCLESLEVLGELRIRVRPRKSGNRQVAPNHSNFYRLTGVDKWLKEGCTENPSSGSVRTPRGSESTGEGRTQNHEPVIESVTEEAGGSPLLQLSQDQRPKLHEQVSAFFEMKSKPAATEPANSDRRKHFEAGIFRQAIGQAYWDATKTHMKPDACVREAIRAGGRTLLSNRSMELKELSNKALEGAVWERIRPNVSALLEMKNFDMRCNQVVAVVTRTMTDAALQFLDGRATEAATAVRAGGRR